MITRNADQLETLRSQVETALSEIDVLASAIPAVFPSEISAQSSNVLHGYFETPTDDDYGYLGIAYDEHDAPVGYKMDLQVKAERSYPHPIVDTVVVEEGKLIVSGYRSDTILYERGVGFADGIGPRRAKKALGYVNILKAALEAKVESKRTRV